MTLAANNNRIALLEMQHVVRGSVDQFAAGAPGLANLRAAHRIDRPGRSSPCPAARSGHSARS
jgi:hypothetical protein